MEKTKGKRKPNCTYLGADVPDELAEQVAEIAKKKSEQLGIRFYISDAVRVALNEWVRQLLPRPSIFLAKNTTQR